jgi:uncharacterized protein (DUF1330 family)
LKRKGCFHSVFQLPLFLRLARPAGGEGFSRRNAFGKGEFLFIKCKNSSCATYSKTYGGGFNYDFVVSNVLISQTENKINRVFTIYFPDEKTSDKFFSDPEYLEIKKTFFERAVESTTIISKFMRI